MASRRDSCPAKEIDMHRAQNQAGITFIGLILILVPYALIGYIVMRAMPAYIESLSVGDAINTLRKEPDVKEKSRDEVYRMIRKRLDVNNITSVDKEDIDIQKTVNDLKVTIDYQAKIPLFANVALAFSFHKNAVVR
jgi:Domain of unknown function (DUF4845)